MERIKTAIEKAKQSSGTKAPVSRAERPVRNVLPATDEHLENISYSSTRTLELNHAHLEKHRIVAFSKGDNVTMSFDLLRTQMLQKMEEHGWRTVAITSPSPECGKTVVAINLAMSIAHDTSRSAILVDFDLRRPKVANYLGLDSGVSLNEVLAGEADLSAAMINPGLPKVVVLPTNRPVPKSSELLSSKKIASLVADLRDRYEERVVLFDLPPLLNTDDAIALLPKIDCVLLVIGNGMVSKSEIEESLRLVKDRPLLGVVLNKAEVKQESYYY